MFYNAPYNTAWNRPVALLSYFYDVSFDMKLHVNEQSICNLYKSHSESEQ